MKDDLSSLTRPFLLPLYISRYIRTAKNRSCAMVWKIDVLRGYIWHQRLHLLQDCWWMKRARQYIGGGEKNKDIFGSCNPAKFSRPPLLLPTYQRRAVQWAVSGGNFQQWLVTTTAHIYRRLRLVFLSVVIILSDVNYLSYFFGLRQITKIHLC